jgi:hypothetical protein
MNDSPFPLLTPEQEAQGYVQVTWRLIAVMGWIIALIMLVGILGQDRRLHAHAVAIDKIPACVVRPFPYDPQDHMRSE